MKYATRISLGTFIMLIMPVIVFAGSATLHWQPNTESDLAGYRIYYGTSSRSYGPPISVDKDTTSYTINNLAEGQTYYFALTAVDTSGNESGYSQEVSKILTGQATPGGGSSGSGASGGGSSVSPSSGGGSSGSATSGGKPAPSLPAAEEKQEPVPSLRVNGMRGGFVGTPKSTIGLTVSLEKGDFGGQEADWWIYAQTSLGRFSYVYGRGWIPGDHITAKRKIKNMNNFNILKIKLPPGTYKFVFAVDNNDDGVRDETWRDSLMVKIVGPALSPSSGEGLPASLPAAEEKQEPVPSLRVNGMRGEFVGTPKSTIGLTVSLEKGDFGGQEADWWIYAQTSLGRFSYVYGRGWIRGDYITAKGKIENVNDFNILKIKLPPGTYKFVFAVDNNDDGVRDETWRDSLMVKIVK